MIVSPSTPLPGPGGGAEAGFSAQDALSRCVGQEAGLGSILTRGGTVLLGGAEGQSSALTGARMHAQACKSPLQQACLPSTQVCVEVGHADACRPARPTPPAWVSQPR